uniref:CARD domain-containing protein n=1 Tax=Plectus sambesii TaxID=2011161 RepID=A0A914WAE3_9BILA
MHARFKDALSTSLNQLRRDLDLAEILQILQQNNILTNQDKICIQSESCPLGSKRKLVEVLQEKSDSDLICSLEVLRSSGHTDLAQLLEDELQ